MDKYEIETWDDLDNLRGSNESAPPDPSAHEDLNKFLAAFDDSSSHDAYRAILVLKPA